MDSINLIGLTAAILTTSSFLPQVIKIWKSRSAKDISLEMFLLFSVGVFLWIIYGISIGSTPVIVANVTTFILSATILVFKIIYR